jgi:hypothetical protein
MRAARTHMLWIKAAKANRVHGRRRERWGHWRERRSVALSASNSPHNTWDKSRISLNYLRRGPFSTKTGD